MTKKDFEAIAIALRDGRDALVGSLTERADAAAAQRIHSATCSTIAANLKLQNARFNRAKFLAACGVSPANTI